MSNQMLPKTNSRQLSVKTKRIAELQRLKAEYEALKNYNNRTMALRIRQVRLWRLFRKIQDINTNAAKHPKAARKPPKTYEQLRGQRLSQARELGVAFSRENGLNFVRDSPAPIRKAVSNFDDDKSDVEDRMSLIKKRLQYGNATSFANLRRFKATRPAESSAQLRSASSMEVDKVEKLRTRMRFDKSHTDVVKYKVTQMSKEEQSKDQENAAKDPVNSIEEIESTGDYTKYDVIKNYTLLVEESSFNPSDNMSLNSEEQDEQFALILNEIRNSVPQLRNVSVKHLIRAHNDRMEYIRAPSGNDQLEEQAQNISCDSVSESSCDGENSLRKISNNRNLPTSQLEYVKEGSVLIAESNEDVRILEDEVHIKTENYSDEIRRPKADADDDGGSKSKSKKNAASSTGTIDEISSQSRREYSVHPSLRNKPGTTLDHRRSPQVEEIVKRFEPFPKINETTADTGAKENFESGVVKLRGIFEHQAQ